MMGWPHWCGWLPWLPIQTTWVSPAVSSPSSGSQCGLVDECSHEVIPLKSWYLAISARGTWDWGIILFHLHIMHQSSPHWASTLSTLLPISSWFSTVLSQSPLLLYHLMYCGWCGYIIYIQHPPSWRRVFCSQNLLLKIPMYILQDMARWGNSLHPLEFNRGNNMYTSGTGWVAWWYLEGQGGL